MSLDEWVTVATYTQPADAHVIRAKLESEGIDAVVTDEHLLGVQPFYSHAIGGAKVQVREEDEKRAREVLSRIEQDPHPPVSEVVCPECQSKKVGFREQSRPVAFLALLLFFLPLPIHRKRWFCEECEYSWRAN